VGIFTQARRGGSAVVNPEGGFAFRATKCLAIVFVIQTVALIIFALVLPSNVLPGPVLKPPPGIREKRKCGISLSVRCFCTGGNSSSKPRKSVKNPGSTSSKPAIISDTLLIISAAGLSLPPALLHQQKVFEALITHQRHPDNRSKNHQDKRHQHAKHMRHLNENRYLDVNV
jgi:hypothetical protein